MKFHTSIWKYVVPQANRQKIVILFWKHLVDITVEVRLGLFFFGNTKMENCLQCLTFDPESGALLSGFRSPLLLYTRSTSHYTVKKVSGFPVPSLDVTSQILPGREYLIIPG